jgi:DNA polymerase III subunit beta
MQLTINQPALNAAIGLVSRAISPKPGHPILANILLVADTESQQVQLTGFDNSIGIRAVIDAMVLDGGEYCIPAKLFGDLVAKLTAPIELTIDEQMIRLASGSSQFEIAYLDPEQYPALPLPEETAIEIPAGDLLAGLRAVMPCISSEETKQVLTGIKITSTPEGIEFAATDGHRLAIYRCASVEGSIDMILPGKAAQAIVAMVDTAKDTVEFSQCDRQVLFRCGNQSIVSRVLEGQYPNYNQLLPKHFARSIVVDRKFLSSALGRIAVMADQKNNVIKLTVEPEVMTISCEAQDIGKGSEAVAVALEGDPIAAAFNVKYLQDALKITGAAEVEIRANTPTSPVVIAPVGGADAKYLLMPVQIRS